MTTILRSLSRAVIRWPFAQGGGEAGPNLAGSQRAIPRSRRDDAGVVDAVRRAAEPLADLPPAALAGRYAALWHSVSEAPATNHDDLAVAVGALVLEAARRYLGLTLYEEQLRAGLALAAGEIVELPTGEGKTLAALLPACLLALRGTGVHVMTTNAYLAGRDSDWLGPVYRGLGVRLGILRAGQDAEARREAYACDVTYGPSYEFGFDFLRDQLARQSTTAPRRLGRRFRDRLESNGPSLAEQQQQHQQQQQQPHVPYRQRPLAAAIVDEADSVLLEEAATPLLLAGGTPQVASDERVYRWAAEAARRFRVGTDFLLAGDGIHWTPEGRRASAALRGEAPCEPLRRTVASYLESALAAEHLLHKNQHYVVRDQQLELVDEHTGRVFADRAWRAGLQQAVQAKERLPIAEPLVAQARITRQRFLRGYPHLCGMTGTTCGAEAEIQEVYGVPTRRVPPRHPCRRTHLPVRAFPTADAKLAAVVTETRHLHQQRRPVLVGAATIERSLELAERFTRAGLVHQLLNGTQDEEEAKLIARAGTAGTVTIATNLAGRGTHIPLDDEAAALGGLHVISSEPQANRRVERQLMGRAARQGAPGSYRLFVSAEDPLVVRFAPQLARLLRRTAGSGGEATAGRRQRQFARQLTRHLERLWQRAEAEQARLRADLLAHDDWLQQLLQSLGDSPQRSRC